jgi:hypothetical protein
MNTVPVAHRLRIIFFVLIFSLSIYAQQPLNEHLQFLAPYVNKTWNGTFVDTTAEKPMHDVAHWEQVLNGQAVRILHSVNDGIYGGETIIYWDKQKETVVYYYFTTAGFYTNGTMKNETDKIICHEYVTGNQNGISEVRSTTRLLSDGKMDVTAEFLKNGTWISGHRIIYKEDDSVKVIFK